MTSIQWVIVCTFNWFMYVRDHANILSWCDVPSWVFHNKKLGPPHLPFHQRKGDWNHPVVLILCNRYQQYPSAIVVQPHSIDMDNWYAKFKTSDARMESLEETMEPCGSRCERYHAKKLFRDCIVNIFNEGPKSLKTYHHSCVLDIFFLSLSCRNINF